MDGAAWIKNPIHGPSLPVDALGLDVGHLADDGQKTRRAVDGDEDAKDKAAPGNAWAAGYGTRPNTTVMRLCGTSY